MQPNEKIITISGNHTHKFKEKGSVFLGQAYSTGSQEDAENQLSLCRKEFYDATHNCYAYKLLDKNFKYSDDGEPNGTAGIRIFNAIEHFKLVNVLVVVTRYYGGTKLGAGPLGKAYYHSAHSVLEEAEKIEKINYSKIEIEYGFEQTSNVHHFLSKHSVINIENIFENNPKIICYIKPGKIDTIQNELTEVSKGSISIKELEKNVFL
jgi:uncharacterized YigZ family protein